MGWDYAYLALERNGDYFDLVYASGKDAEQKNPEVTERLVKNIKGKYMEGGKFPSLNLDIWLRVKVSKDAVCRYSYSLDGKKYKEIPGEFKARQGKWIGAKLGLFILNPTLRGDNGWLDIDWFRVTE